MILTFDNVNWVNEILRGLFSSIDKLIYTIIGWIMEGIFNLAGLTTNSTLAHNIYKRIYVVLALFMIFKLTLSFLQYIINPESMNDKERGVGKLISRVVIMLAMLVLFPILFFEPLIEVNGEKQTLLLATQTGVIKTLPKIILGVDSVSNGDASEGAIANSAAKNGEYMATEMLKAFYYPVSCNDSNQKEACEKDQINNLDEFEFKVLLEDGDTYKYKYMWPLTTIAGIILAIILLGIAIDVAIRVFKLLLLQLLAPVPIMSYIDPKSSKDGAFGSWLKSFSSTYLDIFIKLGSVYLMLMLFSEAFSEGGGLFDPDHGIDKAGGFMAKNFVRVFLVIGLFKFVKDAPKFIKDALGMKDSGNGGGFMGKALSGLAGAAAGFAGGVAAGGLAGGLSGIMSGASSGAAGKPGQAFKQVRDEQAKLLGKTPGGIKGKLQNKAMQRSVMKHTGLDNKKLKNLKEEARDAEKNLALKEAMFNANPHDETAKKEFLDARAAAAKATSDYNDANSLAKQIGMKKGFMEENKRHGAVYVAATRARRAVKSSDLGIAVQETARDVRDGVKTAANTPKNIYYSGLKARDDIMGRDVEQMEMDRTVLRDAKSDYKEMLRGGIGNSSKPEDIETAQASVKNARAEYRDDKRS